MLRLALLRTSTSFTAMSCPSPRSPRKTYVALAKGVKREGSSHLSKGAHSKNSRALLPREASAIVVKPHAAAPSGAARMRRGRIETAVITAAFTVARGCAHRERMDASGAGCLPDVRTVVAAVELALTVLVTLVTEGRLRGPSRASCSANVGWQSPKKKNGLVLAHLAMHPPKSVQLANAHDCAPHG